MGNDMIEAFRDIYPLVLKNVQNLKIGLSYQADVYKIVV